MTPKSRRLRRTTLPVLTALLLVGSITVFANAAASSVRRYNPSLTPTCSVSGSVLKQYSATVVNSMSTTVGQTISSITFDASGTFTFRPVQGPFTITSLPSGKQWNAPVIDGDGDGFSVTAKSGTGNPLGRGESLTVSFFATAPTLAAGSPTTVNWATSASGSGGSYSLDTGASYPVSQIKSACVGPPFKLQFSQQPLASAQAGSSIGTVKVKILDASNNQVPTATNQITLGLNTSNPAALLSGTTTQSAVGGEVTFSGLSINKVGSYTLTATATGLSPDTSTGSSITPGNASKVVFVAADLTDLASGSARNFTVNVLDANDNLTAYSGEIDFAKTGGTGTLGGLPDTTVVASGGSATSHDITGIGAGPVTVQAIAPGLTGSTVSFNVVAGTATKVVLVNPNVTDLKSGYSRTFTVNVLDTNNNLTGYSGSIDFTKVLTSTGTVSGLPDSVSASGGVATSHSITGVGLGAVTVAASASGIAGTDSATFTVVPGDPNKIVFVNPDISDLKSGFTRNYTVNVLDVNNNLTSYAGSIAFDQSAGTGTVLGLPQSATAAAGVATSADIQALLGGPVTVRASATGLAPSSTSFTIVAGTPYGVSFVHQPSEQALPTIAGDPLDPVKIQVVDWQGQPVGGGDPVVIVIGANPGGATALNVSQNTLSDGTVTYNGLVIDKSSSGYTLKACTPDCSVVSNPNATSDPFTISSITATDCQLGVGCEKTVGDPNAVNSPGDQAVTVSVPPIDGSTDTGNLVVTVEGDPSAFASCGAGFSAPVVTIVPPPGYNAANPIQVTFFNYLTTISVGLRPVCKIVDLVGGGTTTTILGACSTHPVPCIQSESYDTLTGRLATTILLTSTDPHIRTTP